MSVKSNTNKAHSVKQQLKQPDSMSVDSRRCHQNSLKYLALFVPHITNCVFVKVWQCAKVRKNNHQHRYQHRGPIKYHTSNKFCARFICVIVPSMRGFNDIQILQQLEVWDGDPNPPEIWEQKYIRNDIWKTICVSCMNMHTDIPL